MSADDRMARDHGQDMRSDRLLRELVDAIDAARGCSRVKETVLAGDLEAVRAKALEYRAQIVRAWD